MLINDHFVPRCEHKGGKRDTLLKHNLGTGVNGNNLAMNRCWLEIGRCALLLKGPRPLFQGKCKGKTLVLV